jgi:ferric iron reductase protein FhuF
VCPEPLAPDLDAGPALHAAAGIGPYFAWQPRPDAEPDPGPDARGDAEPDSGAPGWRPLRQLTDADVIAERVDAARLVLTRMSGLGRAEIGERVVASVVFLGLASRLLSPILAAAAVGEALPVPDPERMWWRPVDGGPIPIAYRGLSAVDCAGHDAAAVASTLTRAATRGLVEPVLDAFGRRFGLSPHVLWGNVASALGGAAGMIADTAPGHAERAAAIVERALALPPLRGTATLTRPDSGRPRWFLVRRNCCLYYRIPGGGTCGDCVLTPERVRRQQWQAVLDR